MKKLIIALAVMLLPVWVMAQDTIEVDLPAEEPTVEEEPLVAPIISVSPDSIYALRQQLMTMVDSLNAVRDSMAVLHTSLLLKDESMDSLSEQLEHTSHLRDSLLITNDRYQKELQQKNALLEGQVKAMKEKEQLLSEKEELYRKAISSSDVDKAKFEAELESKNVSIDAKAREISYLQQDIDAKTQTLSAQKEDYERLSKERDHYRQVVDSLNALVRATELENVRKDEANKYLAQKAKEAEEKAAISTNKKKKVRPIQGIAMRMYRTPDWEILLTPEVASDGTTTYFKTARNRNGGNVEFDFVTGASVMLWDMTSLFNDKPARDTSSVLAKAGLKEIPKFDQQFAYDLGFYVGFGGSNLFKNFYVGPSFRFMDFFYITAGVNICEFEELDEKYANGEHIDSGLTLDNITSKVWKVNPYVSFNIDLDFLSYIKK